MNTVYVFLMGTAFGIGFGLMAAFWRPKKRANYHPPYFGGETASHSLSVNGGPISPRVTNP